MVSLTVIVENDKALAAKLRELGRAGAARAMTSAMRAGMTVLRKAVRAQIPDAKTPGHDNKGFRDSVGSRFVRRKLSGILGAKIGIGVGKNAGWAKIRKSIPKGHRKKGFAAFKSQSAKTHFHFLALGTENRRNKRGANRGRVQPGGYVPRALASAGSTAMAIMEKKLRDRIEAEALKGPN